MCVPAQRFSMFYIKLCKQLVSAAMEEVQHSPV